MDKRIDIPDFDCELLHSADLISICQSLMDVIDLEIHLSGCTHPVDTGDALKCWVADGIPNLRDHHPFSGKPDILPSPHWHLADIIRPCYTHALGKATYLGYSEFSFHCVLKAMLPWGTPAAVGRAYRAACKRDGKTDRSRLKGELLMPIAFRDSYSQDRIGSDRLAAAVKIRIRRRVAYNAWQDAAGPSAALPAKHYGRMVVAGRIHTLIPNDHVQSLIIPLISE